MDCSTQILTCNIRCYGAKDGENAWAHRKDLCVDVIRRHAPDVICFQEMWSEQHADLAAAFPEYRTFGMVDEPCGPKPQNSIFYRDETWTLVSAGGYWLSETPHVAGSKSWDSACIRLANWVRLKDRATGVEFRVVNTHLDHISQEARENQARLIVEDANAYPDTYPQVLTGDMNSDTRNPAMAVFRNGGWSDTYGAIHGTEDPGHTYHGFLGDGYESKIGKMDWVYMRGNVRATEASVIKDCEGARYPSDHYFVGATVTITQPDNGNA